jgi:hypothetical protein
LHPRLAEIKFFEWVRMRKFYGPLLAHFLSS